jgi:hypothetical protein
VIRCKFRLPVKENTRSRCGLTKRLFADGSEAPWGSRLQRTPSRMQITSDSVYRLPQTEIKVVHAIGEGTFGEVVLATNSVFGKIAVKWLKVPPPPLFLSQLFTQISGRLNT